MAFTAPADLVRAIRRYFTAQDSLRIASDVLPVVIVENLVDGPYPPCVLWEGNNNAGPAVGQASYVYVRNNGPPGSVVMVEKFWAKASAASALAWGALSGNPLPGTEIVAGYRNPEKEQTVVLGTPAVGDVLIGQIQQAAPIYGGTRVNYADAAVHEIDGLWIIGRGQLFVVRSDTLNVGVEASFLGRYYQLL